MADDGPTTCERCGGELRRILHPAGIIFKGSGFYKTDSRQASPTTDKPKKDTAAQPSEDKAASATGGEKPPSASSGTGTGEKSTAKSESSAPTD